jgi:hypothetical protein
MNAPLLFIGNLGGGEIIIIALIVFLIPFSLGYFIGLSRGRREHLKSINPK